VTTAQLPQQRSALDNGPAESIDDAVIVAHLPLVEYALAELRGRLPSHVSHDDLRSAGRLALVQAGRAFDPSRGVPFARFASRRISGAMVDELRRTDWASRSVRARARERSQVESALTARLGRKPLPAELAEALGISLAQLHAGEDDLHRAMVLSLQAFEAPGGVEAVIPAHEPTPEAALLANERTDVLVDAVDVLPEQMRAVVVGLFWQERTTAELAEQLSVTESRVSQIKTAALKLLRDGVNSREEPGLVALPGRPGGCVERRRAEYFAAVAARAARRQSGAGHSVVA
jgi:RNA polymerase sigma factor for flagellar operon FliA